MTYDFTHSVLTRGEERELLLEKERLKKILEGARITPQRKDSIEKIVCAEEQGIQTPDVVRGRVEQQYVTQYVAYRKVVDELVRRNIKLAAAIAYSMSYGNSEKKDEYTGVGIVGLGKAIERFDPIKYDNKLSSYAAWYIRQQIRKHRKGQTNIHIPSHVYDKVWRAQQEYRKKFNDSPSHEELSVLAKLPIHVIQTYFSAIQNTSLDAENEDGESFLHNSLSDNSAKMPWEGSATDEEKELAEKLLEGLTQREQDIIRARFGLTGESQTLEQLGQKYGLTRERIRQIEAKALIRLRMRGKKALRSFRN